MGAEDKELESCVVRIELGVSSLSLIPKLEKNTPFCRNAEIIMPRVEIITRRLSLHISNFYRPPPE